MNLQKPVRNLGCGFQVRAGWQDDHSFVGDKWQNVNNAERKQYLKNAYRVLLTRARQGMVIVVPEGDDGDGTRRKGWYDETWKFLQYLLSINQLSQNNR